MFNFCSFRNAKLINYKKIDVFVSVGGAKVTDDDGRSWQVIASRCKTRFLDGPP